MSEYDRFTGSTVRELRRRLQEPLPCYCPRKKLPYAVAALDAIYKPAVAHPRKLIAEVRWRAFTASDAASWQASASCDADSAVRSRRQVIADSIMGEIDHGGASFDDLLFADLPNERRPGDPPREISIAEIRLHANSLLTRSILLKSRKVTIQVSGKVLPVVRQAKLRGLICAAYPCDESNLRIRLEISGPLSLFRHARVYGSALAELVPFLANCNEFVLHADSPGRDEVLRRYVIQSGDPIFPKQNPRSFDSRVERLFAKDFGRATKDFDLIRDPAPVAAGDGLVFPDFGIRHRVDNTFEWRLEIVGYWTTAYLRQKIEALHAAKIRNLILCVDRKLWCSEDAWPSDARVILYDKGRIDPMEVLRSIGWQ